MNSSPSNDPDPIERLPDENQVIGDDQDLSRDLGQANEGTRLWESEDEKAAEQNREGQTLSGHLPEPEIINRSDESKGNPTKPSEPTKIGRYEVIRKLGEGGFGSVYLTHDPELNRKVAIKLPKAGLSPERRNSFTEEGRSVARLSHPSIVNIFNIEKTEQGDPFVVMEFVEGPTLRTVIREQGLTFSTSLKYLIHLAEALEYAHGKTLIHRDIKPANVVISTVEERAKLMDFGLAIHDLTPEEQVQNRPEGTPPYMSPEQIRGENHRLDHRTDLWAFGVLMYIMLSGRKPFQTQTFKDLTEEICHHDPRSLYSINKSVPMELDRICHKCLEKLMSSRYQSTKTLVDDLKSFEANWLNDLDSDPTISSQGINPTFSKANSEVRSTSLVSGKSETSLGETKKVRVVPKGLRSFDSQDAEFFIDLLPGPKDRFGVPESLRFWINRISRGVEDPIPVGMVFGPSGCGKSSFVKAGLIPRLEGVKTIYVEAAADETEKRIFEKLTGVAPQVAEEENDLVVAFTRLRRGQTFKGEKLLIVIDQFEQWLHSHPDSLSQELTRALRQCDGEHLCCLLLVRDDFWMSATQFMAKLDLKVQEGVNALGMPLFDRRHARRVLTAYGQANEAFGEEISSTQSSFIANAVSEMSDNGRVIPIHLALFSQMMDSDSWDSGQLKKMGGWKGLGVHFLNSIFSEKKSAAYEETCRSVLGQLLPDIGTQIKGSKKSFRELLDSTKVRSGELLQQSLDFLDRELRIITPTESDATSAEVQHFQLAHDFLVEPVRDWLSQKAKETRQGRAQLRLEELSSQWSGRQEKRFLPSLLEYASIRSSINKKTCSIEQASFLRASGKHWATRISVVALLLVGLGFGALQIAKQQEYSRANDRVDSLLIASPGEVNARLELLEQYDKTTVSRIANSKTDLTTPRERIHLQLVKAKFGKPADLNLDALIDSIQTAESGECRNIVEAIRLVKTLQEGSVVDSKLTTKFGQSDSDQERFRLAVVSMHLGNTALAQELLQHQFDPESRAHFIESFANWRGELSDVVETVEFATSPSLRSGLCCALGQVPQAEFRESEMSKLVSELKRVMRSTDHAEVHSSSRWLLEQLGIKPLEIDRLRSSDSSWFVKNLSKKKSNSNGATSQEINPGLVTFVRVEPQTVFTGYGLVESTRKMFHFPKPIDSELDDSFHISAREVSAGLFYEFVETLPVDHASREALDTLKAKLMRDPDLPITDIQWQEAALFCNWLSAKEGLRPWYSIDKPNDKRKPIGFVVETKQGVWSILSDGNGYRLPTNLEWEAACRAGTKSRYWFGNKLARQSQYAISAIHPFPFDDLVVDKRGQKLPNGFGLFDMVGNAYEWCHDIRPEFKYEESRPLRGGHSVTTTLFIQSSAVFHLDIGSTSSQRTSHGGIRLVIQLD